MRLSSTGYRKKRLPRNKRRKHFDLDEVLSLQGDCRSQSSKTSSELFRNVVVEGIKHHDLEDSTKKTYHTIWKDFLIFLSDFDNLPQDWEDKMVMYAAHLANTGTYSATVSSYMSAIRYKLKKDGVTLNNILLEIASIVRSCKKLNDKVILREPLHKHMLKRLLDIVHEYMSEEGQLYLLKLYKAMFTIAYYGFMRIGELTASKHVIKMKDVKIALNKKSVMILLRSSKTHGAGHRPKEIKIPQVVDVEELNLNHSPFHLLSEYKAARPKTSPQKQFFVFKDGSPVKPHHFRALMKKCLKLAGYDVEVYDCHSWRIGCCHDLLSAGVPLSLVKKWGRWKDDNSVLKYFKA